MNRVPLVNMIGLITDYYRALANPSGPRNGNDKKTQCNSFADSAWLCSTNACLDCIHSNRLRTIDLGSTPTAQGFMV